MNQIIKLTSITNPYSGKIIASKLSETSSTAILNQIVKNYFPHHNQNNKPSIPEKIIKNKFEKEK